MAMHPSRQAYVEDAMNEDDNGIDYNSLPTDTNYSIPSLRPGQAPQEASAVLSAFARKRKVAALAVPTDDSRVREALRSRGEPITLFGERPEDRRDRLREIIYSEQEQNGGDTRMQDGEEEDLNKNDEDVDEEDDAEFYTEGPPALLDARRDMARYSLPRARRRTDFQKRESQITVGTHVAHRTAIKNKLGAVGLLGSQIASNRAMSMVRFAPSGDMLAAGDWDGSLKILDVPNLETQRVYRGHTSTIGGICWFPSATLPTSLISPSAANLASSGGEGNIHLWNLEQDTPLATLAGHSARVCRIGIHPSGKYLASASYDTTWRLWDVQTTTELLLQEGHSKEVYSVAFNDEGSLVVSAGLDSIGRIWDLRTGRTIMLLDSHVGPIYATDWSPDCCRVVTGSADGFAKVWDLRVVRETASLGAHMHGVSDIRWFKGTDGPLSENLSNAKSTLDTTMTNGAVGDDERSDDTPGKPTPKKSGTFLVSSGFDKAVTITSADDWAPIASLTGHDGTVLAADVSHDAKYFASCGRDRTVKLWARDDMEGV